MPWKEQVRRFEAVFDYTSTDWQETECLKNRISTFREQNPNSGLSMGIFTSIVDWKLRNQRGRTEAHRANLTAPLLVHVTQSAFDVEHEMQDIQASVQVGILSSLPGVGIGVSTAILALTFPESHGIIDFRIWKVVFRDDKRSFTTENYISYLYKLRAFAEDAGWSVQKADFMIWKFYDELAI